MERWRISIPFSIVTPTAGASTAWLSAMAAIRFALARGKRVWQRALERNPGKRALPAIVDGYLSPAHRDAPGNGCVVAALGTDIARQPRRVRQAFTKEIKDDLKFLSRLMANGDHPDSYEDAIVAFASMAGALILARAVNDEELSDLILKSTAKRVIKRGKVRKSDRTSRAAATKIKES